MGGYYGIIYHCKSHCSEKCQHVFFINYVKELNFITFFLSVLILFLKLVMSNLHDRNHNFLNISHLSHKIVEPLSHSPSQMSSPNRQIFVNSHRNSQIRHLDTILTLCYYAKIIKIARILSPPIMCEELMI